MVPQNYQGFGAQAGCMWAWEKKKVESGEIVALKLGDCGKRFILDMYKCIKIMHKDGFNVIVDDVWMDKDLLNKIFAEILNDCKVYFIGVNCDLKILQEREIARNNRVVGSAIGQHELVHQFYEYDFIVDTSQTSSRDCALKIKDYLESDHQ
jgi:chloramphenicol 3-O phosphotransferase